MNKLIQTIAAPQTSLNSILFAVTFCLATSAIMLANKAQAETVNSEPLIHDMNYYNPLKHNQAKKYHRYHNQAYAGEALDNQSLERVAQDIRNHNMSTEQRALNHRWLQYGSEDDDVKVGSKVISSLFKMGFRTYWDGVRNKHYSSNTKVPDGSGNGKVTEDVDYKVRLSSNKLKLSMSYDF